MPAIGDFEYGYEASGVQAYLDEIHADCIVEAQTAVEDTSSIETILDNEWEGKARDNFKQNLKNDAKHVSEQFDALYTVLTQEINSLQAAMANKDEELIEVD